jgi:hypothetical protein
MIPLKRNILFVLAIVFTLSIASASYSSQDDKLKRFADIIGQYGWKCHIGEERLSYKENVRIRGTTFVYEFPEKGDDYFQKIGFWELAFKNVQSAKTFRIENYKPLFPGVVVWEHYEYIKWRVHRLENIVYIVYAYVSRQDIDTFFQMFTKYLELQNKSDFSSYESKLKESYEKDRNFFQAVKVLQSTLRVHGFYKGSVDGLYGSDTIKGFQRFLKMKGFYEGEFDGVMGKSSMEAVKKYQKSVNKKVTGQINLETANAMQRENIE